MDRNVEEGNNTVNTEKWMTKNAMPILVTEKERK